MADIEEIMELLKPTGEWSEWDEAEAQAHADAIYYDQLAQLSAIEDYYGIEPRGWEDSY